MPEFLKDEWKEMEQRNTAAALAVRRSLELVEVADLEEVMYLLDALAEMGREDAIAAPFLPRFTVKDSLLQRMFDFDQVREHASQERERLRELIYHKCTHYDREESWKVYSALFASLYQFCGARIIYVVTTNYDRIIEELWEDEVRGLQLQAPRLELQTGFFRRSYGNPVLEIERGYPDPGEDADAVVRLIKIHGSLGWREYQQGRVAETGALEYPGQFAVLAYPLRKNKSNELPFAHLYEAFDRALAASDFIVAVGMSLRDVAIVERLTDALRDGRKRLLIVDPEPEQVRNRLPSGVRRYVGTNPGRFGEEVRLTTVDEWEAALALSNKESL